MKPGCEHYQAQLLDYVYQLLDGADERTLLDHVQTCPACQAALARAQGQQQQLASAARLEFGDLHFCPPGEVAPAAARSDNAHLTPVETAPPAILPLASARPAHKPGRLLRTWQRLALAASVLFALVGFALFTDASRDAQATASILHRLHEQHQTDLAAVEPRVQRQHSYLTVTVPQTIQPGTTTECRVENRNLRGELMPSEITVNVIDKLREADQLEAADDKHASAETPNKSRRVLFSQTRKSEGEARFQLPASLPNPRPGLKLEVLARSNAGPQTSWHKTLTLAEPDYVTHLTTDKPIYRPGDLVSFRSLTLERFTLQPPEEDLRLSFTLLDPHDNPVQIALGGPDRQTVLMPVAGISLVQQQRDKEIVVGPDHNPLRGIGAGVFPLPKDLPGGSYTLKVEVESPHKQGVRFPGQVRRFTVQPYDHSQLLKELYFSRASYGPGEEVVVHGRASRLGGGVLAHQPVKATVQVDGRTCAPAGTVLAEGKDGQAVWSLHTHTDAAGAVTLRFRLPEKIETGKGNVLVHFTDGAVGESIEQALPIAMKKLHVHFRPEGGDLVNGVPQRVYFDVRTPADRPADIAGRIVDAEGKTITTVRTVTDPRRPGVNQGLGWFTLTPQEGHSYELKLDAPAEVAGRFPLPAERAPLALHVDNTVSVDGEPIRVQLHVPRPE
ncbi:MAG: hypothetical protein L0Z62_36415, partial [Gemmataceae bacterium]|nr:hypothetical protein [Gemmataceae bacterium]